MPIALALAALLAAPVLAGDCVQERAALEARVKSALGLERVRAVSRRVAATLTAAEAEELSRLSARFNAIPHDTPAHQEERFALQGRGRELARAVTARAGYRIRNPFQSPYDAVIEEAEDGGVPTTVLEVRELLVQRDPTPHATLWVLRSGPKHNPWDLVTVGVRPNPAGDYASWRGPDGRRVSGSFQDFLDARACKGPGPLSGFSSGFPPLSGR